MSKVVNFLLFVVWTAPFNACHWDKTEDKTALLLVRPRSPIGCAVTKQPLGTGLSCQKVFLVNALKTISDAASEQWEQTR